MATPGTIPRERPSLYELCPLRTAVRHQPVVACNPERHDHAVVTALVGQRAGAPGERNRSRISGPSLGPSLAAGGRAKRR